MFGRKSGKEEAPGNSRSIKVNNMDVPYRVERRNVKFPRLEFTTGGLLAILPKSCRDETPLLREKMGWISEKYGAVQRMVEDAKAQNQNGDGLLIFGDFFEFRESESLKVDFDAKTAEFSPGDKNHVRRLERILRRELLAELEPAVEEYSRKLGAEPRRITIKKLRSRWGSCSSGGNLNFNLWLVCLPRKLVRYLACHEVAHLREKNHRRAFWGLVGREFGNYREMERRLSEYWLFIQEYPCNTTKIFET
jgi:hypothetical protein